MSTYDDFPASVFAQGFIYEENLSTHNRTGTKAIGFDVGKSTVFSKTFEDKSYYGHCSCPQHILTTLIIKRYPLLLPVSG